MSFTRRRFLVDTGLLAAVGLTGCRRALEPSTALPAGATSASPAAIIRADRAVTQTLAGMPTVDGAGVRLTRIIGQPALRHLDPFILLDRIHSDDPTAWIRGFPDHPHRGFETVTVMLVCRMRHRDSR